MNERNPILDEIAASGLFDVMTPHTLQTQRVLAAMAYFADPSTRELTKSVYNIALKARSAAPSTMVFPDQTAGVIRQLCESGIVEEVSEGKPPAWRIAGYQRLVEVQEMIAGGELSLSHFDPGPTGFTERGSPPR